MKISALVTTFVLGISSIAAAAPGYSEAPAYGAPARHDRRMPMRLRWTTLASAERLIGGRDAIQLAAPVQARQLKLEANFGSTFVDKVIITFANGRSEIVQLGQRLGQAAPVTIDLQGQTRMISKIIVVGRGGRRASYSVLAA